MWSLTFRPGRFRSLAQLYAVRGRQAVSFSYDDRASLVRSSGDLITALEGLCGQGRNREAPAHRTTSVLHDPCAGQQRL